MKRTIITAGIAIFIAAAVTGCLRAQPGTGSMAMHDTVRMHRMERMHMGGGIPGRGNGPVWGYRYGMRGRGFGPGAGYGMRNGMGPGRQGFRQGEGAMRMLNMIPNLTDKQRQEILKIRQQQEQDMLKIRQDMQTKMQALRQSEREKLRNVLTDDQKKFLDEHKPGAQPDKPAAGK